MSSTFTPTSSPAPCSSRRILVIGGGGVGTIAAYNFEMSGRAEVTMVLRSNYKTVSQHGFNIESCDHGSVKGWKPSGGILNKIPKLIETDPGTLFDYIICCNKSIPDIPPSLESLLGPAVVNHRTAIVLLQNGINIERPIIKSFPENIVISGVSFCGAMEGPAGHITHNDHDKLLLGPFNNERIVREHQLRTVEVLLDLYQSSGKVTAEYDDDPIATRWRKLIFNAVYNPSSALTQLDTSRLRLFSTAQDDRAPSIVDNLIRPGMREVAAVAYAVAGVKIGNGLIEKQIEADPIDGFIMPSMQQDVQKGRFIECESILGEVVREARKANVSVPILTTLYCLCNGIQWRTREPNGLVDSGAMLYTRALRFYQKV